MNQFRKIVSRIAAAGTLAFTTVGVTLAAGTIPDVAPSGTVTKTFDLKGFFTGSIHTIVNVVFFLAAAAAIVYLIWGGVKYITAGGDTKKAGEARQAIINAVIGIAVVVGAYTLINIAFGLNTAVTTLPAGGTDFQ
jgi:hypothetical protein